jgi:hypothetical protein
LSQITVFLFGRKHCETALLAASTTTGLQAGNLLSSQLTRKDVSKHLIPQNLDNFIKASSEVSP